MPRMSRNKSTQKVVRSPRRYLEMSKQPFSDPICPLWESGGLGTDPRTKIWGGNYYWGAVRVQVAPDTHTSGTQCPHWYTWGGSEPGVVVTGHLGHPNGSDMGKEQGVFFFLFRPPPPHTFFYPPEVPGVLCGPFLAAKRDPAATCT